MASRTFKVNDDVDGDVVVSTAHGRAEFVDGAYTTENLDEAADIALSPYVHEDVDARVDDEVDQPSDEVEVEPTAASQDVASVNTEHEAFAPVETRVESEEDVT